MASELFDSLKFPSYHEDSPRQNEEFYREAIYQLEQKLNQNPTCIGLICDWIANYHELATIYQEKGNIEMAQQCLYIPHESMLYMARHNPNNEDKKLIAMSAMSLTLPPLLEFAKTYPPCEHCMKELQTQMAILESRDETYH